MTINLELGGLNRPYFEINAQEKRVCIGFCIGSLHLMAGSLLALTEQWCNISHAVMTDEQEQILEEGIKQNVDFNVLLTRLSYETKKRSEDY